MQAPLPLFPVSPFRPSEARHIRGTTLDFFCFHGLLLLPCFFSLFLALRCFPCAKTLVSVLAAAGSLFGNFFSPGRSASILIFWRHPFLWVQCAKFTHTSFPESSSSLDLSGPFNFSSSFFRFIPRLSGLCPHFLPLQPQAEAPLVKRPPAKSQPSFPEA